MIVLRAWLAFPSSLSSSDGGPPSHRALSVPDPIHYLCIGPLVDLRPVLVLVVVTVVDRFDLCIRVLICARRLQLGSHCRVVCLSIGTLHRFFWVFLVRVICFVCARPS